MSDLVFNRASLTPAFASVDAAQNELTVLLRALALVDASEDGPLPILRLPSEPWLVTLEIEAREPTSLGQVAGSLYASGLHDVAQYFDSLASMSPADADLDDAAVEALLRLGIDAASSNHAECFDRAKEAGIDLLLSTVVDGTLVSLPRAGKWDIDHLAFRSGNSDMESDHVATEANAATLPERRRARARKDLSVKSFAGLKSVAFPHLLFGTAVDVQLEKVDSRLVDLTFRRLADLDRRVATWRATGTMPDGKPEIVPETEDTMKKYGEARNFPDAAGNQRSFIDHLWIDGLFRIHVFIDRAHKTMTIGYIGRHLPTMKYRT